jgi:hypothetical protein
VAQRILAVVAAVACILVAVVVRRVIDDDGSDPRGGGDGEVVLVCAADLADACDGLTGVTVIREPAATTAAALEDGSLADEVDGWVTTSAWTEIVEERTPDRIDGQEVLARSPVAVAVDPRRTSAVQDLCAGDPVWRCLGDSTGVAWSTLGGDVQWGDLKVGLPSASSATGLSVLASVASGYFGATDFASNDFGPSGFESWLGSIAAPSGSGEESPVRTLVTTRGKYTAVGDVAAAVGSLAVDRLEPLPPVDATVVLVDVRGGDRPPAAAPLRQALVDDGWDGASGDAPPATLKPGVMAALYTLWTEITR